MKFMKYVMLGLLALGVQGSVKASAKPHAKSAVEIARQGGAMGFGAFIEHPELAEQSRKKELAGSYKTSPQPVSRGNVDAGEFPSTGYGQATRHSSSHSVSPQSAGYAASSPFSSLRSSASTLQHERATTDPHHPDHLRVGDPTAAILGRKPSSSNLPKYEHRVSHTPTAAQVQQSPQRPSFFSNFKSNARNVRGFLQPSYKANQEVKQAKNLLGSLTYDRDVLANQIRKEGKNPYEDPRWQAAQNKVLAGTLERDLKISLANKSISKEDLQAIQSHDASVDLQKQRLDNLRGISINNRNIDRLKAAMKKGTNSRAEAEKLMKDMSEALADDEKYHNQNKQLFAPPARPVTAPMPEPGMPVNQ